MKAIILLLKLLDRIRTVAMVSKVRHQQKVMSDIAG